MAADIDVLVDNSTGQVVAQGVASGAGPEAALAELPAAGDYFIEVYQYEPADSAPATAYGLTLSLPECETSFECTTSGEPICSVGECVAGPAYGKSLIRVPIELRDGEIWARRPEDFEDVL